MFQCLQTPEDVLNKFYPNTSADEVRITLSDFSAILPRIIFDLQSPDCTSGSGNLNCLVVFIVVCTVIQYGIKFLSFADEEEHDESEAPKNNRGEG